MPAVTFCLKRRITVFTSALNQLFVPIVKKKKKRKKERKIAVLRFPRKAVIGTVELMSVILVAIK